MDFLNKLNVRGHLVLHKSFGAVCPAALVHFMALCHNLVILAISQDFSLSLYLL